MPLSQVVESAVYLRPLLRCEVPLRVADEASVVLLLDIRHILRAIVPHLSPCHPGEEQQEQGKGKEKEPPHGQNFTSGARSAPATDSK